ncbi:MAG: hypothetical protein IT201_07860 [Thermoleophilia bacterium]|nr:hypothetical protein [Thermoleophilia bacterium]
MEALRKLAPATQVVLGGSVLYLIFSFLDWQQACVDTDLGDICAGISEWHGVGIVTGLLVLALLAWEAVRLLGLKLDLGPVPSDLVSPALAALLLLFTLITFLSHNEARHWPAWIGLLLSVVIAGAVLGRWSTGGARPPGAGH